MPAEARLGDNPVIETKCGKLRGFVSKIEDDSAKPVYNFLNVPFGKPPTGNRRFMPPERIDAWDGVRDATKNMRHPIQDAAVARRFDDVLPMKLFMGCSYENQDEDCLNLNLFTPSIEKTSKLPVLLWIVGGGFMRGSACAYDGGPLCGLNDVIVVSPNYRVNAFGFLSLGKGTKCPGNNGVLDVILALKWVQDNISDFGGDPDNVTIFGESAGGVMVELLMMSPLAEGLFHKGAALSGSILATALFDEGRAMSEKFLSDLNIPLDEDPDVILKKLQALSTDEIVQVQRRYDGLDTFKPCVDGRVMVDHPRNILKAGKVHRVPFMSGVCDCEGGGLLCLSEPENFFTGCSVEAILKIFEKVVSIHFPEADKSKAAKMLVAAYSPIADDSDKMKYSKIYSQVLADVIFIVPAVMSITALSSMQIPTYFYVLAKRLQYNHSTTNGPGIKNKADYVNCDHGDTCHYVWGVPFVKGDLPGGAWFTKEETECSRVVMKYLTNFAKSGDPNKGVDIPTPWPHYEPQTRKNIVLDETVTVAENYGMQGVKLHTVEIPQMMKTLSNS